MRLYAIGDLHGSLYDAMWAIDHMADTLTADDALLCLGDVGIKYGWRVSARLLSFLSSLPCTVLAMRGNHDTRYCRDLMAGSFGQRPERVEWCGCACMRDAEHPNVLYLPDEGGVITINGHRALVVPGAWSIDGKWRLETGNLYEAQEQLTPDERANLLCLVSETPVEHIFSHTCPESWLPELQDLFLPEFDQSMTDKTMERWMDELLAVVRPTLAGWWFGHFHDDRDVADVGHMLYGETRRVL